MQKELKYYLALNRISGLTARRISHLLKRFTISEVFRAKPDDLICVESITKPIAMRIGSFSEWDEIDREIEYIEKNNIRIVTIFDDIYPAYLKEIFDPPFLLYARGDPALLNTLCFAIVGSRNPTSYGREVTRGIVRDLVALGFTIVSGFAQGIDSESHRGAIENGGRTIGVLGSGIDVIYPRDNFELYHRMIEGQLIVTEFPVGTEPFKGNFPRRNRIISGLSRGVLVVEATIDSGSLITARCALEQDREVFAVPGMVTSSRSKGCHLLIKQGARLVEGVEDILEEFGLAGNKSRETAIDTMNLSDDERLILEALRNGRTHIDLIIERVKRPSSEVAGILTSLELNGIVKQLPGKYFELRIN